MSERAVGGVCVVCIWRAFDGYRIRNYPGGVPAMNAAEQIGVEADRLNSLISAGILDTPPEAAFDGIARAAASVHKCPIALVSFVDKDRIWFKARVGLEVSESPRAQSFCSVAIESGDLLIVPDAGRDPRFAENAMVTGPPHIRFYAGAVIRTAAGQLLGTVCIIDQKPRHLAAPDLEYLTHLADTVGSLLDDRRSTREMLALSEVLADAVESSPNGLVVFDQDDRLVTFNRFYGSVYGDRTAFLEKGMSFEDMVRTGLNEGYYPDAKGIEEQWFEERLEAYRNPPVTVVQRVPNGRWVKIDGRRTARGYNVGFVVDVTEMKEQQAALEVLTAELTHQLQKVEAADAAKQQFLASVSHDLRTPLNAIIGFSELITSQIFGEVGHPKYTAYAEDIQKSGQLLLNIVDDILDMARLSSGRFVLDLQPVALADCIRSAMAVATQSRNLSDEAPPIVIGDLPPVHVIGDDRAIRQIIMNLVSNALKFTPAGGRVSVSASDGDGSTVSVRVTDTGCGITADDLKIILEPFQRVGNVENRPSSGSGLGLAIVRSLVEAMNGDLHLESTPGVGTSVSFTLPSVV